MSLSVPFEAKLCLGSFVSFLAIASNSAQAFSFKSSEKSSVRQSEIRPISNAWRGSTGEAALNIPN